MSNLRVDFAIRSREVDGYFAMMALLESPEHSVRVGLDADVMKTVRASGFLVLYNLVESTARNAVEAIHDHLCGGSYRFDLMRAEMQRIILSHLREAKLDDSLLSLQKLVANDMRWFKVEGSQLFSGNVDARLLRRIADKYGFVLNSPPQARGGARLLDVKNARNDLGHGSKSFEEVGRDKTLEEMVAIKVEVVTFLSAVVDAVEDYITSSKFLAQTDAGSP
jgi:hypothetical protein